MKKIATTRMWARCPHCGAKTVIYDNTSTCNGVWMKCTRGCHKEFELVIRDGKQINVENDKTAASK